MLYYNLSSYLRKSYGKRLKKICIDAGFTCPNRDGRCGYGGCIFCGERGAGEHIDPSLSIKMQVESALGSAEADDRFIAYFQNFTNTYEKVEVLRERYDSALIDKRIKILSIGTRPDCIDEDVADLIAEYTDRYEVWVELGLQTANDETAKRINRGYLKETFENAMRILKSRNIKTVVHLILGLPGEGMTDAIETAGYVSGFEPFGVKIHSLYIMKGTALAKLYEEKSYTPPSLDEYADMASEVLARIPKATVIHRITGDCPRDMLVAPDWNKNKNEIIDAVNSAMKQKGYVQGGLSEVK